MRLTSLVAVVAPRCKVRI